MLKLLRVGLIALVCCASQSVFGQENESATLTTHDITLFIESYQPISEDLEILSERYSSDSSADQAISGEQEASRIFMKYGWTDRYMQKVSAILSAYTYATLELQLGESPATIQASIDGILPQFKSATNDSDVELVKLRYQELSAVINL